MISDTHFGLISGSLEKEEGMFCEPEKVGQFVNWLIRLKNGNAGSTDKITLMKPWSSGECEDKTLKPPDKLIMIGDILELWDADDRAIDFCSRPIFDLLSKLNCEKIYLLGNHDYGLHSLNGIYPSGEQTLTIVKDHYPFQSKKEEEKVGKKVLTLRKGNRDYLFLHGHQFDKFFRFLPWRQLSKIRSGAVAFGRYGDIFIVLFLLGIIIAGFNLCIQSSLLSFLDLNLSFWGLLSPLLLTVFGNAGLILLWAILGIPRIFYLYGRDLVNRFTGIRYQREKSMKGILGWWQRFSKDRVMVSENLRIVYGHTHLADEISSKELSNSSRKTKKVNIVARNIPAWVKDWDKKHRQKLRATCLYIDEEDELFIGWDWENKKPFFVPIDAVKERRKAKNDCVSKKTGKHLLKIGWPLSMVEEWMECNKKKSD
ncbi:MAG: metallophosphoesterase [Promethearchaeota archaeon]